MATARELLEQASALMRRNRRDDAVAAPSAAHVTSAGTAASTGATVPADAATLAGESDDDPLRRLLPDVPTLSEVHAIDASAPLTPTVILPEYAEHGMATDPLADALAIPSPSVGGRDADAADWLASLAELPVLTDVVEVGPASSMASASAAVPAPRVEVVAPAEAVPPVEAANRGEAALPVEAPATASDTALSDASARAADARIDADWPALAEEIRTQVFQRLDLFTDTGLREQLGAHLKPIVERASAELVDTINRQVGELVRSYVAEAIEREIEAWRNRGP